MYYLGLLAYGSQTNGDAQYLIANIPANTSVNPNVPTTTSMVDLTTSPPTVGATIIANGGGGNMITGPDGCIYMSLGGGGVWKITDTTGACKYTGTAAPSISLTPTTLASNPQQGKPQKFTARFHDVTVADGTPVSLNVTGANPQFIQVNSVGGAASFTYTGAHQGVDNITASATVSSSLLTSNEAVITWGPGSDVTFLTLNLSPTGSAPGQPVTVTANLTDISDNPSAALAGQSVNFTIGGAGCGAATNSSGDASCQITPSGSGLMTLAANFPGTAQYNASSDSKPFSVVAPEAATPIHSDRDRDCYRYRNSDCNADACCRQAQGQAEGPELRRRRGRFERHQDRQDNQRRQGQEEKSSAADSDRDGVPFDESL